MSSASFGLEGAAGRFHFVPTLLRCGLRGLLTRWRWAWPVLVLAFMAPVDAGAQTAPDEDWRTAEMDGFRITFPVGKEELAQRAAVLAREAYDGLAELFVEPPGGTIDILLTDHSDLSNGFAWTFPSNRIVLFLPPPVDGLALSHFDEWLRLVISHELAHIFHLDQSSRFGYFLRSMVGRAPSGWPLFPNRSQPRWAVEGVATYYESALSDHGGRVHGTFHDMVLRTAAVEGRLERLDQALGASPLWPAGDRPYVYGSRFFDHLIRKYGEEWVGSYSNAVVGQWIPLRLNSAAEDALGVSFSEEWDEWVEVLEADARETVAELEERAPLTEPERLTREGWANLHPETAFQGDSVVYYRFDGRSDPQLRMAASDGSGDRKLLRVNGTSPVSWDPSGRFLFAQLEYTDPYRIRWDLYSGGPDGSTRRLTHGARLSHGHLRPGGGEAVAVQDGQGSNRLVRVDVDTGRLTPLGNFVHNLHWAYPRWSPDGRWIAAGRWSEAGRFQVVIVDPETGETTETLPGGRALDTAPAWGPEGARLIWASDRSGISNLYGVSVDPETGVLGEVRQVTNLVGGALFPAVDPGGDWIYFSSYGPDGWDLARIPYRHDDWFEPFGPGPRFAEPEGGGRSGAGEGPSPPAPELGPDREYSPIPTVLPRYWAPVFQEGVETDDATVVAPAAGIATSGRDLVERHVYSGRLLVGPRRAGAQWWGRFDYAYAGLGNPVMGLRVERDHDALGSLRVDRNGDEEDVVHAAARERSGELFATLRQRRVQRSASLTLGLRHLNRSVGLVASDGEASPLQVARPNRRFVEGRLSAAVSTARTYPFSVGREEGVSATVRLRSRRERAVPDSLQGVQGRDGAFHDAVAVVQGYTGFKGPGYGNHVLALRAAVGGGTGPGAGSGHFRIGGASGDPDPILGGGLAGGTARLFPVRGYPSGIHGGSRAWSVSLEYRVPLSLLHRGFGTFPLHLDRLSGGVFVDAGGADGTGPAGARAGTVGSAGAELVLEALPFWLGTTPFRVGFAVPWDGSAPTVHFRVGRAF